MCVCIVQWVHGSSGMLGKGENTKVASAAILFGNLGGEIGCKAVRWWECEVVRWCLQLPAFPLSPPKGVLWSYIYHLVWGEAVYLGGKSSHGFTASKMFFRSSKFKTTTEIYEPEWHLSFGVVWVEALSRQFVSEGFSWLFLAFLGASYLPKSSLSQKATLFVYSILCSVADMVEGYDAFVSEEEGFCLVQ